MRRTAAVLLVLSVALAGCKAKEVADKAAISKDLEKRGTTDLMKEVADDKYTPPEDGRLTEAQVQMYLKVREHEKKIAEVAKAELKQHAAEAEKKGDKSLGGMMDSFKALGSAADFLTADIRAAKDLGYNSQEYLWVKGQILAASTAQMAQKFNTTMTANMEKAYADAKKAHDEAKGRDDEEALRRRPRRVREVSPGTAGCPDRRSRDCLQPPASLETRERAERVCPRDVEVRRQAGRRAEGRRRVGQKGEGSGEAVAPRSLLPVCGCRNILARRTNRAPGELFMATNKATLRCSRCDWASPIDALYNLCPACSAPILVRYAFATPPRLRERVDMWRYADVLPIDDDSEIVTLGEGLTPCFPRERALESS